jgi:hypothetical protein
MEITNKHIIYILLGILTISITVVVVLFCQCVKYKEDASKEAAQRQRAEWTINDAIRNVGESVSLDSIVIDRHLILRYDSEACLTCIAKAEELLEDVFGKEYLTKELCCIGAYGQVSPFHDILGIQSSERITPMDDVYTPYFCVITDNGDILFTLSLIPDNYDYNRNILLRLRKKLMNQEESCR